MSALFLGVRAPKLLLLAGTDRLDRDLTIGQMQGRFQLALLPKARSRPPCCDMSPMFWQRMDSMLFIRSTPTEGACARHAIRQAPRTQYNRIVDFCAEVMRRFWAVEEMGLPKAAKPT